MKRFNLLFNPWIPVKTRFGENKPIKAFEIVQEDIVAIDAPRADFNAALMQFLIGLLQTVIAPNNPREWRRMFNQPPSENELKNRFEEIKDAFYLDGDGYRFMQDVSLIKIGKYRPIEEIIFGAPGERSKEKNQDHFVKQNDINGLCHSCATAALLTSNIFAEDGGRGYFQSMRGNGFISCLVQLDERRSDKTLWRNLWLNVMDTNVQSKIDLNEKFYWLKDVPETDSLKVIHPTSGISHVYWAWLRRYYLDTKNIINGSCSICKKTMNELVTHFYKVGQGYKYPKEEWQNAHPFSPSMRYERKQYDKNTLKYKDKMLALEMTQNGLPYTYWQDFLPQTEKQTPAKVVNEHLKKIRTDEQLIIWSFGYTMDSNSPKGWYESKTPLYLLNDADQRKEFEIEINRCVQAANKISDVQSGYLSAAIRMAWFGYDYDKEQEKKKDKKPDPFYNRASTSFYNHPVEIAKCFWNNTESKFYDLMEKLYDHANKNELTDEKRTELRQDWYNHIKKEAENLFNRSAFRSGIQNNPKRIAKAYNQLINNLNSKSLKQEILALP